MKTRLDVLARGLRVAAAAALGLGALLLAWPRACPADSKIHVNPPPPPPPTAKTAPTFEYKHEVRKVVRDRKPVIALLRPGDAVALQEYLPFGRGVTITKGDRFDILTPGRADDPVFLPSPIRPFLVRELIQTGEFVVIERERILEIARELALAKTQAVNPDAAPRPGCLVGVHYIVEASYWPVGGLPSDDPALDGVKREIAKRRLNVDPRAACVMYLTIYKVQTGEVKAVACGADLQPMVAVKKAVEDLVDQLGEIVEPIKVARVNPETGVAVLDIGSDSGVKPGDQFAVGPADAPSAKLEVMVAAGLSSTAKVAEGEKAAVREGQVAHPLTPPPAAGETPPPAKPPAALPAPAPAKTGG